MRFDQNDNDEVPTSYVTRNLTVCSDAIHFMASKLIGTNKIWLKWYATFQTTDTHQLWEKKTVDTSLPIYLVVQRTFSGGEVLLLIPMMHTTYVCSRCLPFLLGSDEEDLVQND